MTLARELAVSIDYSHLSKRELYKLCRHRGISIIESKRENRKYLEQCLKDDGSINESCIEQKPQYELWKWVAIKIEVIFVILICVSVSVFIYHFIYLHT